MPQKRTFKINIYDLIAAMVFLGRKVTPEDITNYLYNDEWSDIDKYDILRAVNKALDDEMAKLPEDHYGLRKSENGRLYWLNYKVS